jgi:hypothetical protein
VAGDLDGDTDLDLAAANQHAERVSVLLNGGGGLAAVAFSSGGLVPGSVAIADLDGDGKLDLALATEDSNRVSVLLNQR